MKSAASMLGRGLAPRAGLPGCWSRALSSTARRPRVLILGTGWGGNKLARKLDKKLFDVRVVSPANHFLFTSFLPSTAVGTLEFRAIQEPIRTTIGLGEYYQAKARAAVTQAPLAPHDRGPRV